MSVRRPFSPPLHSAARYTRKHLHAGQRAAPPNHAEWADAKRVRSISTVRSVRFEPLASRGRYAAARLPSEARAPRTRYWIVNVPFWGQAGKQVLILSLTAFEP